MKELFALVCGSASLLIACGATSVHPQTPPLAVAEPPAPTAGLANLQPAAPNERADAEPARAQPPRPSREPAPASDVKFDWTDRPSLQQAPEDGVYVSIGGRTVRARHVEVDYDSNANEWRIEATTDDDARLGPTLTFTGKPAPGVVAQRMGANGGAFQVPLSGAAAASAEETQTLVSDNARVVQITSIDAPRGRGIDGHVSGKFVVVFRGDGARQLWAAGTFVAVPYVVY